MNSSFEKTTPEELIETTEKRLEELEEADRNAGKDAVVQILEGLVCS